MLTRSEKIFHDTNKSGPDGQWGNAPRGALEIANTKTYGFSPLLQTHVGKPQFFEDLSSWFYLNYYLEMATFSPKQDIPGQNMEVLVSSGWWFVHSGGGVCSLQGSHSCFEQHFLFVESEKIGSWYHAIPFQKSLNQQSEVGEVFSTKNQALLSLESFEQMIDEMNQLLGTERDSEKVPVFLCILYTHTHTHTFLIY